MDKQYLKRRIGSMNTILEIGAADGNDTRELMQFGKVYAFEPEPRNIAVLEKVEGLELFRGAVSDTDGKVIFNRSRTNDPEALRLSGSILPPKNHLKNWDWIFFDEKVEVETITLDTWWKSKGQPVIDFIWCDAQGAEAKIIQGGKEAFKSVRYFFTEYCNDEHYEGQVTLSQLIALLPDFEIIDDIGTDVLFKNKNL